MATKSMPSIHRKANLAFGHFLVCAVDPRRVEERAAARSRCCSPNLARRTPATKVNLLVQCGGDAVDAADKRAVTSADHSHAQFAWSHQWKRFHKSVIDTRVALKIWSAG
jgi:hypothetical protein